MEAARMPAHGDSLSWGQFESNDLDRGVRAGDGLETDVFGPDGHGRDGHHLDGRDSDGHHLDGRDSDGHHLDGRDSDRRLAERPVDARVRELEEQVVNLQAALQTQRQISMVVGILAYRVGRRTDEAWGLVARLSQETNVKVREVARVICEAFDGHGRAEDAALLAQLIAGLPVSTIDHRDVVDSAD
jgi:hypothetical protein